MAVRYLKIAATVGLVAAAAPSFAFEPKQTVYLCAPGSDMACVLNEVVVWNTREAAAKAPLNNPFDYSMKHRDRIACWVKARKKAKLIEIKGKIAEVDITISSCQGFVTVDYLNETQNGY